MPEGVKSFWENLPTWARWVLPIVAVLVLIGLAVPAEEEDASSGPPQRGAHEQDIYDQQRGVCQTEQQHNTIEYREQKGATDPQRYAEYAARHGFYEVRNQAELEAAVDGCLAGLRP